MSKGKYQHKKGYKRPPLTEEHKKKIGEANKGKTGVSGEKSHFWKGGITPEHIKSRNSTENCLWREAVFARDNWTCQKCLVRSGNGKKIYITPHHIKNFSQYSELRFIVDNGITFCRDCHRLFHKIYDNKNNTREQLDEFLLYSHKEYGNLIRAEAQSRKDYSLSNNTKSKSMDVKEAGRQGGIKSSAKRLVRLSKEQISELMRKVRRGEKLARLI